MRKTSLSSHRGSTPWANPSFTRAFLKHSEPLSAPTFGNPFSDRSHVTDNLKRMISSAAVHLQGPFLPLLQVITLQFSSALSFQASSHPQSSQSESPPLTAPVSSGVSSLKTKTWKGSTHSNTTWPLAPTVPIPTPLFLQPENKATVPFQSQGLTEIRIHPIASHQGNPLASVWHTCEIFP